MKNFSDESWRQNKNKHFVIFFKIVPFCETMWKSIVEPDRAQMTICMLDI